MLTGRKITVKEGFIMMGVYIAFITIEIFTKI
jgi:Ca2+/Na+ antiporter